MGPRRPPQPQGKTLNPDGNVVATGACPAPAGAGNAALDTGPGPLLSSDYQTEFVRNAGRLAAALAGCRLSGPSESRVTQQPVYRSRPARDSTAPLSGKERFMADPLAVMASSAADYERLGLSPTSIEPREDGARTDDSAGTYE